MYRCRGILQQIWVQICIFVCIAHDDDYYYYCCYYYYYYYYYSCYYYYRYF